MIDLNETIQLIKNEKQRLEEIAKKVCPIIQDKSIAVSDRFDLLIELYDLYPTCVKRQRRYKFKTLIKYGLDITDSMNRMQVVHVEDILICAIYDNFDIETALKEQIADEFMEECCNPHPTDFKYVDENSPIAAFVFDW